jgi:hypothetical protein
MPILKVFWRILVTTILWAVVCGLSGAVLAVVVTITEPDTGHIPREFVPLMVGVPTAALGALGGIICGFALTRAHADDLLGFRGRKVIGGYVGGAAAIICVSILVPSFIAVIPAGFLGAVTGARLVKWAMSGGNRQKPEAG